jgi:hypothetical protein
MVLFGWLASSRAAGGAVAQLEWVAPAGCPSREGVLEEIDHMVGGSDASKLLIARVSITQVGPIFRGEVELGGPATEPARTLEADSCGAVAEAAAVVIAFAVNQDAPSLAPAASTSEDSASLPSQPLDGGAVAPTNATAERPPEPQSVRLVLPAEHRESTSPLPPAPREAVPLRWPFVVGAAFVVDTSLLPSTTYGGEITIAWRWSRLALELSGALLATQTGVLPAAPSQGARFGLWHLGARGCYAWQIGRVAGGPCVGGGVDWIDGRGFGSTPDVPADATGRMFIGAVGGQLGFRLASRIALRLVAETIVPAARPRFVIDGGGTVFEAAAVSLRAAAGAEAHF